MGPFKVPFSLKGLSRLSFKRGFFAFSAVKQFSSVDQVSKEGRAHQFLIDLLPLKYSGRWIYRNCL